MYAIRSYYASVRLAEVLHPWRALRRRLKSRLDEPDYQALLGHELALERLAQEQLLAAVLPAPGGGSDARRGEPLQGYLRITSYNVCYTKLLRGQCTLICLRLRILPG